MQTCIADEGADFAQDTLAQLFERQLAVLGDKRGEPFLAKGLAVGIHRLGDPVGEQQHHIAHAERNRHLLEQAVEPLAVIDLETEHQTIWNLNLNLSAGCRLPAAGSPWQVDQRTMPGSRVCERTGAQIHHGVGHGDEAARVEMLRDDAVGPYQQLARRRVELAEREHQAFQLRHVERGGGPLPRHVGDDDADPLVA